MTQTDLTCDFFSPNLIKDFLEMIRRNDRELQRPAPRVFVSSIFEISANHSSLPASKHELVSLLNSSVVIPFHKTVCPQCHKIPKAVVSFHSTSSTVCIYVQYIHSDQYQLSTTLGHDTVSSLRSYTVTCKYGHCLPLKVATNPQNLSMIDL